MKIIDLLNRIANGEEVPAYVKYINFVKNKEDIMMVCKENIIYKLDQLEIHLNDEVEIIEEEKKIPEKSILDVDSDANGSYDTVIINGAEYQISRVERYMLGKINEIIDYINGGTNGE